ncbi:MAG: LacI family transcriptional regulator [Lachnospiraceae bacterium]|nr:LacI family transcriptional regulator [Lachnospiraceae bacterium]
MVSMKDIAKACDVSVATVSKALNDHSDISVEKKLFIKNKAKELGYFPNSSARALKTNRTYNIGVLFVDEAASGLTHDYFAHVLDSFKVYAESKSYDITFINCQEKNGLSYLEHCKYRGFDGIVIACVDFYDPEVIELINSDIPVVTVDHAFDHRIAVVSNNVEGISSLVNYVYDMGHRKIAYIIGDDTSVTQNRIASFHRALNAHKIMVPDHYIKRSHYRNPENAEKLTYELLNLKDRPTCIFYPDDYSAIGGINAIHSKGLSIPGDISVVGYDGFFVSQVLSPKLTTYAQNTTEIGHLAAGKLIELIENPRITVIERILVSGKVLPGESVGKLIS